jgi:hypothetical protein
MGVLSQFDFGAPSPPLDRGGGSGGGGSGGLPAYPYPERTPTRHEVAARSANSNLFSTFRFSLPFELNPHTTSQLKVDSLGLPRSPVSSITTLAESSAREATVCQLQHRISQFWGTLFHQKKE